jgi:hypothetical protein
MPTAQEALGQQIQGNIPAGGNIAQVNNFAPGIVEFVSVSTRTLNAVVDAAPATTVGGGILPFVTHVSASPYREYLVLPSTIQPGDTVSLTIDGGTHVVTLPTSFSPTGTPIQYDGDRINDTIPGAALVTGVGDELGGPIVHTQTGALAPGQRGLVVYEHQPETAGGGRMFVINPNQASGIPIPAFRTVATTPATGTLVGEGILNTTSGVPYVWDGLRWNSIVPPSIITYPTDADVLNDGAAAAGTYAFSQATGNLFVRYTSAPGTDVWREIGIMKFPTEAGLLAATPADGSIAYAVDSGNYWNRIGTTWEPFGVNLDTEAHLLSVNPADGAMSYAIDTNRFWTRLNGTWQPLGVYSDTEAAIHATSPQNGTVAYATDTGNMFARVNGGWSAIGVIHNTNAAILASTEPDGTLAYATDLHDLWARIDGAWQPISIPHDTTAHILAATGWYDGARAYATDTNLTWIRVNGAWVPESVLRDTQANVLAAQATAGRIAIATDTQKIYVGDGTNWVGQPFRDYATEAGLLAATPADGVLAIAVDTGKVYYRSGGNWISAAGTSIPVGTTDPAAAASAQGDLFFNSTANQAKVFTTTGGAGGVPGWVPLGAGTLNDMGDVDTATTAPDDKDTLVWDDTAHLWKPGKGAAIVVGNEPALADRFDGMIFDDGVRTWIWLATPGCWREV